MTLNKTLKHFLAGLGSGLVMLASPLVLQAEEAAANAKPPPPPPPPFNKAPVVHTKYTKNCKPLGLTKAADEEKRRTFALDPGNFRRMEKAAEAMGEENYDEALVILEELDNRSEGRPYDQAKAREYTGYAWLSKGNYDKAINYFKQVIDQQILPVKNEQSLIRNVAGLYLAIDPPQPDRAMGIISKWFETAVNPKSSDYVLLGQAAVLGKMYEKAICPIRMAINLDDRPKSSWFDILVAAHFELDDFEGAAVVAMERLLSYPQEGKYWRQMSGLYSKLEKFEDAMIILELAHRQGYLTKGSEYRNLASMYSINDLSFKAAQVMQLGLDKGIIESTEKTWKQAATSWQVSRENTKAIAAYEKAGAFVEHGLNEMRIGTLYSEKENWKKAAEFFRKALEKGGLKDSEEGRTHMNLGIALYNSGNPNDAIKSLKKAQDYKAVQRNAGQWLNYVRDSMQFASN